MIVKPTVLSEEANQLVMKGEASQFQFAPRPLECVEEFRQAYVTAARSLPNLKGKNISRVVLTAGSYKRNLLTGVNHLEASGIVFIGSGYGSVEDRTQILATAQEACRVEMALAGNLSAMTSSINNVTAASMNQNAAMMNQNTANTIRSTNYIVPPTRTVNLYPTYGGGYTGTIR